MHPIFSIEISTHIPKSCGFQGFRGSSGIVADRGGLKWVVAGWSGSWRVEVGRSGSWRVLADLLGECTFFWGNQVSFPIYNKFSVTLDLQFPQGFLGEIGIFGVRSKNYHCQVKVQKPAKPATICQNLQNLPKTPLFHRPFKTIGFCKILQLKIC